MDVMPEVTITDLANLTGLSRKTVSKRLELSNIQPSKSYDSTKALAALYSYETASLRLDRLNKTQLSVVTGYAPNTVTDRIESALVVPDDDGYYDAPQALAAIFEAQDRPEPEPQEEDDEPQDDEPEQAKQVSTRQSYEIYRTEYMRAKAEREQLTLDKERGRYLIADDVKERVSTLFRNVRTRLLAIPQRLTQTLAPDDTPKTIEKKVSHEIETALNELTRLKL
jgi:phage terminase Nu1 subunit (DNA packaging protein)